MFIPLRENFNNVLQGPTGGRILAGAGDGFFGRGRGRGGILAGAGAGAGDFDHKFRQYLGGSQLRPNFGPQHQPI